MLMKNLDKKNNHKGWIIAFWLLVVAFIFVMFKDVKDVIVISNNQATITKLQNEVNNFQNSNAKAQQKCIAYARQASVLDPYQYPASYLQSAVKACQTEYPTN